ncbi:MAG: STAS/SEC14 domain-containing protein [Planctomycetaceae bacterium]
MSFEIIETAVGNVIEVHATGKLTKEAYQAFVPMTEEKIREHGKIRILFIMHDFHGWTVGAAWEDIKFDLRHFNHIERLAIVGETKWEKGMSAFCRPFTTATIKYFDHTDVEKARQWIQE